MKSDKSTQALGFSTRAIHHAYDPYEGHGALNPPLYLSSTYTFPTVAEGAARFAGEQPGYVYSRVGNPTTRMLEERLANLENGEAALVTASGQGATTSLLWTLLAPGDELIADKTLYGCTFAFFHQGSRHAVTDVSDVRAARTGIEKNCLFLFCGCGSC
jgi:methionine-gamma-lyase